MPQYKCSICYSKPDQLSHHKSHLKTSKHKDKRELFKLQLEKLTKEELQEKYKTNKIENIIKENETIMIDTSLSEEYTISNNESLKEHIHSIHNFLRNSGGGYGLGALKIFNIFYGIKKIEEHHLNEVIGLGQEYWFSSLLDKTKNLTDEEFNSYIVNGLLNELYDKPLLKVFLFYEIPKNIKSNVFRELIQKINDITRIEKETNVLLSGKVYEYFVGRDESAISELGAYFTNRLLVEFTISKVNPQLNEDGTFPSMIDMFGGSGGFTTGFVNYMSQHYDIDWSSNVHNIFHYDINEDVLKAAALEIFCLTGQLPNMDNIAYKNSFKTEFTHKYKYILTNPPYGGDKNKKSQAQEKRDILKKHIMSSPELKEKYSEQLKHIGSEERKEKKNKEKDKVSIDTCSELIINYAKEHHLTGNDKESCSLILLMATLDIGGTCAGVLKEGVMFDKKYKALRKCLVENFNVREVVSIPADQFENTTTKTSLVIFDNTEEKTCEIKFSKLDVIKYTENKIEEQNGCLVLSEMAEDISGCQEVVVSTATIQDFQQNSIYSLNGKDYNQTEIVCGQDYELVELGSICEINNKKIKKFETSYGKTSGKYKFHTGASGYGKYYCDEYNIDKYTIIINKTNGSGKCNISIDKFISCAKQTYIIQSKQNEIETLYIYNYLSNKIPLLEEGYIGACHKNLSGDFLYKFKIPVPKNPEKIQHWVDKISQPYNEKNEKQTRIQELEKTIQERIQSICDDEDCEEVELGSVCEINNKKIKKFETSYGKTSGKYKFHTGASGYGKYYCDEYNIDKYTIIINKTNGSGKCNISIDKFISCAKQTYIIQSKQNEIETLYIYNYLSNKIPLLEEGYIGACHKNLSGDFLYKFKIKLPKNKKLIDDLNPMFQEIDEHQQAVKIAEELYKKYIQELGDEAMPNGAEGV